MARDSPSLAAMKTGENIIDGVPVDVERKRIRRINIRIRSDGRVCLSVPRWWATFKEGEAFLRSKWPWVIKARSEILARQPLANAPVTDEERLRLATLINDLHSIWMARLNEPNVLFRLRKMTTLWGSCHWRKRVITYSTELAHIPENLVEYVVVHELTHLQAHNHGPRFYALMDARLPGWKLLRRQLNKRTFDPPAAEPERRELTQAEFRF